MLNLMSNIFGFKTYNKKLNSIKKKMKNADK